MSLSENLKKLRKSKGYTQQDVAEYLDIDTTNYGRIERGMRNLSADRLKRLATFYKTSVNHILNETETELSETTNSNDFLEHLKKENEFLRNSVLSKDKQIAFLTNLLEEYKTTLNAKKKQ